MNRIVYDIFHWLIFGFILSILPIIFGLWAFYNNSNNQALGLSSALSMLTSHGEILLVCIPAIGFGFGELVRTNKSSTGIVALLLFGISLLLICSCIYIYTQAATTDMDAKYLYKTSRIFLLSTLIVLMAIIIYTSNKKAKNESIY